jgi:hypothetical protein
MFLLNCELSEEVSITLCRQSLLATRGIGERLQLLLGLLTERRRHLAARAALEFVVNKREDPEEK